MRLTIALTVLVTACLSMPVDAQQCHSFGRPACKPVVSAPVYNGHAHAHHADVIVVQPAVLVPSFAFQYLPALYPTPPAPAPATAQFATTTSAGSSGDWPVARLPGEQTASASHGFSPDAVRVLQNRCAACHSGAGKGGVSLFDASGAFAPNTDKNTVLASVSRDQQGNGPRMPKGAAQDPNKALSAQEIDTFRQ